MDGRRTYFQPAKPLWVGLSGLLASCRSGAAEVRTWAKGGITWPCPLLWRLLPPPLTSMLGLLHVWKRLHISFLSDVALNASAGGFGSMPAAGRHPGQPCTVTQRPPVSTQSSAVKLLSQ